MTKAELVRFLRLNVNIQNADVTDTVYLSMTDEDIELYLALVLTRDFPQVPSLDLIPQQDTYPVILLAKKELYFALASADAPLVDLIADNNNQIKRAQRFEHYMKLIAAVDEEYNQYNEDGGAGARNTLTSFDVLISDRYATRRNYEKGSVPALSLRVLNVTDTTIEIQWAVKLSRFACYKVYVSLEDIIDEFSLESHVKDSADLVATILNIHQNQCRIEGLIPNTVYHIAVSAVEMSTLTGSTEVTVTTLSGGE
jgi:hypothetical protein